MTLVRLGPAPGSLTHSPANRYSANERVSASIAGATARDNLQQTQRLAGVPLRAAVVGEASMESSEAQKEAAWVEIGVVGPPHGLDGSIKIKPTTDFPKERLGTPGPRWLRQPEGKLVVRTSLQPRQVQLESGRKTVFKGHKMWIVKLQDVSTKEQASNLRNHVLLIREEDRENLGDDDEFYLQDVIGAAVYIKDAGDLVGWVSEVHDGTGTCDVLRIVLDDSSEEGDDEGPKSALLPFVVDFVPHIDVLERRIEITPPGDWLDVCKSSQSSKRRRGSQTRGKEKR